MDAIWLDEAMLEIETWLDDLLDEFEAEWSGERMEVEDA